MVSSSGVDYFTYAGEDKGSEAAICVVVRKPLSMLGADLPLWLLLFHPKLLSVTFHPYSISQLDYLIASPGRPLVC